MQSITSLVWSPFDPYIIDRRQKNTSRLLITSLDVSRIMEESKSSEPNDDKRISQDVARARRRIISCSGEIIQKRVLELKQEHFGPKKILKNNNF